MNQVALEEAELPIVPLTDCESDIFPVIQLILRILCFSTGYLLINSWKKEIKAQLGWQDESTKNVNTNENGFSQTLFKALSFCLSQILNFAFAIALSFCLPSSHERRHATYKDAQERAPGIMVWHRLGMVWHKRISHRLKVSGTDPFTQGNQNKDVTARKAPSDYGTQSDLEYWLNHLSSVVESAKALTLSQLKEEIHANLLAQRALRVAIELKSESVAQQVYDILTRQKIAIGRGTFELMVQANVHSGNAEAATEFLTKMEALGHKVSPSLMLLVENVNQEKNDMNLKIAKTTEEGSREGGTTRRTSEAAETNDSPFRQDKFSSPFVKNESKQTKKYLAPDPTKVPETALGFGADVPHQSLAVVLDSIPSESTPVVPGTWLEPKFKTFYFDGLGNVEPGKDHFSGQITVVDFLHPTEVFVGQDWLRAKLQDRRPIGWDVEWRPDHEQGSDNPVALMQFASEDSCLLLRTHRMQGWLPRIVRQILCSGEVAKISYAYDTMDRQKMLNSFGFQPQCVVDIMQLSNKRGLVFKGLRGLAEHFQLRMKKDARITCTDWACSGDLMKEQIHYAAEDAYFAFLIYKRLEEGTKSKITDRRYSVNQATERIADNTMWYSKHHIYIASQQPQVESMIRSMSHYYQVSMLPVDPYVRPSFCYQYQMQPRMQYLSCMDNCTTEADGPSQNSGYPSEAQVPWRTATLDIDGRPSDVEGFWPGWGGGR